MMYSGGGMDNLKNKIMKVLDAFNADKYNIPEDYPSFNEKVNQVEKQLVELRNVNIYLSKIFAKAEESSSNSLRTLLKRNLITCSKDLIM